MNLDRAGTEAFVRFLEFEDSFDRSFKFSVAALRHMERVVGGPGGPTIIRGLIADAGSNWRDDDGWKDPIRLVRHCVNDAALLGLVQVHSAVDDFVVGMEAYLSCWRDLGGAGDGVQADTFTAVAAENDPLEKFCQRNGWDCRLFNELRPILGFFRTMRHCVAHRAGLASAALVRQRNDAVLVTSVSEKWNGRAGQRALPAIEVDEPILLEPRLVILALEAAHRACLHINNQCVRHVGEEGMIFMAAHHTLLSEDPDAAGPAYLTPATVVNYCLTDRYRILDVATDISIQSLKKLGVWKKCTERHGELFGDPPRPSRQTLTSSEVRLEPT